MAGRKAGKNPNFVSKQTYQHSNYYDKENSSTPLNSFLNLHKTVLFCFVFLPAGAQVVFN